jgi:hypothetical protein
MLCFLHAAFVFLFLNFRAYDVPSTKSTYVFHMPVYFSHVEVRNSRHSRCKHLPITQLINYKCKVLQALLFCYVLNNKYVILIKSQHNM